MTRSRDISVVNLTVELLCRRNTEEVGAMSQIKNRM